MPVYNTVVLELSRALSDAGQELAETHAINFSVSVEHEPQQLHPIAREEVYQIAREAITMPFAMAKGVTWT